MEHFESIIPVSLAEELKENGMLIVLGKRYEGTCPESEDDEMPYQVLCSITYSQVFDWCISKGFYIMVEPFKERFIWKVRKADGKVHAWDVAENWIEAAKVAIHDVLNTMRYEKLT